MDTKELGAEVQAATGVMDRHESDLLSNTEQINTYMTKKHKLAMELELLDSKDVDTLSYNLKVQKLDLKKDISELDSFISFRRNEEKEIKHTLDVAGLHLTAAKGAYSEAVAINNQTATGVDIDFIKSTPTSKMSIHQKKAMFDKFGDINGIIAAGGSLI